LEKLIILSIVIVSLGVPAWLSTAPRPRRGLRRAQVIIVLYVIVWGYMCTHWYPELVPLK
jgi:hypothetical protein